MDFHSLCQKLDVDSIRAKFPALPAMPTLPQIKLPKSMSKIKSRKIFRSSRENVNRKESQKHGRQQELAMGSQTQLACPPLPHATFIRPTPTRISTISSLVHEDSADGCTYRSADSIDDFSPLSRRYSCAGDMQTTLSPMRASSTVGNGATSSSRLTFTQKLHQSYKDLSEFRIKHIFAKKTVIRKDDIQVEQYVQQFKDDLARETQEQETRDKTIADNYSFRFKLSRQNLDHSNSVTPNDSPHHKQPIIGRKLNRTVGEHSGDESGMEATPPPRKPGIAATRFARVRSPPLRQSSSEDDDEIESKQPVPIPSALWSTKINRIQVSTDGESEIELEKESKTKTTKSRFNYKERMRRLASYISTDAETAQEPAAEKGSNNMLHRLKSLGKRHENSAADLKDQMKDKPEDRGSPYSTDDQAHTKESPTNKTFKVIKNNFKRLQKSIKTHQKPDDEGNTNQTDSPSATKTSTSKSEQFVTHLRRFRSRDVSTFDKDDADEEIDETANAAKTPTTTTPQSPIRQAISNKLENWKKSFKKKPKDMEQAHTTDGETSPEKQKPKRADTLIKKLKHIRARKQPTGNNDELEPTNTDNEQAAEEPQTGNKSKPSKFTEARQRTLKKVNEKMQQIKFFHKSQEQIESKEPTAAKEPKYHSDNDDEEDEEESEHMAERKPGAELHPAITSRDFPVYDENSTEPESDKSLPNVHSAISIPGARASWTNRPPLLSESMDSDADASEFPRVLIHQDNTEGFESTLIIAVTRSPASASTKIMELEQQKSPQESEWIPNKNIIAGFLETTPPGSRRKKSPSIPPTRPAPPKRRKSMESNSNSDSDSITRERRAKSSSGSSRRSSKSSQAGLISIDERNEAWKIKSNLNDETTALYKSKSIDIFEKNVSKGGALTAFEDFDDELKNEPVLKISAKRSVESCERESSEDTADDDNSSRITKISVNRFREASVDAVITTIQEKEKDTARERKTLPQYANSRESLVANFDENEENENSRAEDDDDDDDSDDRPPSAAPSPPPKMSPPPPPLPQRQPSLRLTKNKSTDSNDSVGLPMPPLPKSKPPMPPSIAAVRRTTTTSAPLPPPPRIPERTASMPRAPKPLVKTSSLRLVFSEQVRPADVGKVNKLISRFEPTEALTAQRPRIIPRRMQPDDSEEYSDDEEDFATIADKLKERYANIKIERDTTPTPTNTPKMSATKSIDTPKKIVNRFESEETIGTIRIKRDIIAPMIVTTTDEDNNTRILTQQVFEPFRPIMDLPLDLNANCSRPNSEYGSPLEYPSSLRSSLEAIPILEKRDTTDNQRLSKADRRSRRSMPRDNENYYSFDSDEENSYYSISSTGSNRYVVEL